MLSKFFKSHLIPLASVSLILLTILFHTSNKIINEVNENQPQEEQDKHGSIASTVATLLLGFLQILPDRVRVDFEEILVDFGLVHLVLVCIQTFELIIQEVTLLVLAGIGFFLVLGDSDVEDTFILIQMLVVFLGLPLQEIMESSNSFVAPRMKPFVFRFLRFISDIPPEGQGPLQLGYEFLQMLMLGRRGNTFRNIIKEIQAIKDKLFHTIIVFIIHGLDKV